MSTSTYRSNQPPGYNNPLMQAASQNDAKQIAWYQLLLVAAIGTGLSVVVQGFFFGKINNVYHIPIVLKLFDSPQFANDPFYQSLRNFTSLVWPGLSLITT